MLKKAEVQYNSSHTEAGIKWRGKKSRWLEEGEAVGDGRTAGSSVIGERRQAAAPLRPDAESLQREGSICGTSYNAKELTF